MSERQTDRKSGRMPPWNFIYRIAVLLVVAAAVCYIGGHLLPGLLNGGASTHATVVGSDVSRTSTSPTG